MKSTSILLFAFIFLLSISSCKQCPRKKALTEYGYLDEMIKYFGMYQQNNWWVYKNNKHTKIDSIFISDFNETIL